MAYVTKLNFGNKKHFDIKCVHVGLSGNYFIAKMKLVNILVPFMIYIHVSTISGCVSKAV